MAKAPPTSSAPRPAPKYTPPAKPPGIQHQTQQHPNPNAKSGTDRGGFGGKK